MSETTKDHEESQPPDGRRILPPIYSGLTPEQKARFRRTNAEAIQLYQTLDQLDKEGKDVQGTITQLQALYSGDREWRKRNCVEYIPFHCDEEEWDIEDGLTPLERCQKRERREKEKPHATPGGRQGKHPQSEKMGPPRRAARGLTPEQKERFKRNNEEAGTLHLALTLHYEKPPNVLPEDRIEPEELFERLALLAKDEEWWKRNCDPLGTPFPCSDEEWDINDAMTPLERFRLEKNSKSDHPLVKELWSAETARPPFYSTPRETLAHFKKLEALSEVEDEEKAAKLRKQWHARSEDFPISAERSTLRAPQLTPEEFERRLKLGGGMESNESPPKKSSGGFATPIDSSLIPERRAETQEEKDARRDKMIEDGIMSRHPAAEGEWDDASFERQYKPEEEPVRMREGEKGKKMKGDDGSKLRKVFDSVQGR